MYLFLCRNALSVLRIIQLYTLHHLPKNYSNNHLLQFKVFFWDVLGPIIKIISHIYFSLQCYLIDW